MTVRYFRLLVTHFPPRRPGFDPQFNSCRICGGRNDTEVGFFFVIFSHGVRLSPFGTSANNWPIVPAPDHRWCVLSSRWNENWQRKRKYLEKTCPSATLSTTNPTWPDSGSKTGRRGGKPATNRVIRFRLPNLIQLTVPYLLTTL
jgi:hypothetical protein